MSPLLRSAALAAAFVLTAAVAPAAGAASAGSASSGDSAGTLSSGSVSSTGPSGSSGSGSNGGDGVVGGGSSGSLGSLGSSGSSKPGDPGDPTDPVDPAACMAGDADGLGDGGDHDPTDPGEDPTGRVMTMVTMNSYEGDAHDEYVANRDVYRTTITVISPDAASAVTSFDADVPVPAGFSFSSSSLRVTSGGGAVSDVRETADGISFTFTGGTSNFAVVEALFGYEGPDAAVPTKLWPSRDPAFGDVMVDPDGAGPAPAAEASDVYDPGVLGYNVVSTDTPAKDSAAMMGNAWAQARAAGTGAGARIKAGDCVLYRGMSMVTTIKGGASPVVYTVEEDVDAPFALKPDLTDLSGIVVEGFGEGQAYTVSREAGKVVVTYQSPGSEDVPFVVVTVGGTTRANSSGKTIVPTWRHSTAPVEWVRDYFPPRMPQLWGLFQPTGTGSPVPIG